MKKAVRLFIHEFCFYFDINKKNDPSKLNKIDKIKNVIFFLFYFYHLLLQKVTLKKFSFIKYFLLIYKQ